MLRRAHWPEVHIFLGLVLCQYVHFGPGNASILSARRTDHIYPYVYSTLHRCCPRTAVHVVPIWLERWELRRQHGRWELKQQQLLKKWTTVHHRVNYTLSTRGYYDFKSKVIYSNPSGVERVFYSLCHPGDSGSNRPIKFILQQDKDAKLHLMANVHPIVHCNSSMNDFYSRIDIRYVF